MIVIDIGAGDFLGVENLLMPENVLVAAPVFNETIKSFETAQSHQGGEHTHDLLASEKIVKQKQAKCKIGQQIWERCDCGRGIYRQGVPIIMQKVEVVAMSRRKTG